MKYTVTNLSGHCVKTKIVHLKILSYLGFFVNSIYTFFIVHVNLLVSCNCSKKRKCVLIVQVNQERNLWRRFWMLSYTHTVTNWTEVRRKSEWKQYKRKLSVLYALGETTRICGKPLSSLLKLLFRSSSMMGWGSFWGLRLATLRIYQLWNWWKPNLTYL